MAEIKTVEMILHKDLPIKELKNFKKELLYFESKFDRKIGGIDIIGEIEVCDLLGYDLVKSAIQEGYDAKDGKNLIQIKATRAQGTNSRTSAIKKENKELGFDFILLARYLDPKVS